MIIQEISEGGRGRLPNDNPIRFGGQASEWAGFRIIFQ